jgi:hypothetical protein
MLDVFQRDLLLERLEVMLPIRLVAGYYPHLTLAQGQRFAVRGGYITRFADATSNRLIADGDYTVP